MTGGTNGDTPNQIEDLIYDENEPVFKNKCSGQMDEALHTDECDRNCERIPMTQLDIDFNNEMRAWARAQMDPRQMQVGAIDTMFALSALKRYITVNFGIDEEEFSTYLIEARLQFFKFARLQFQDQVREDRLRQQFALPGKAPLLGPNGQPL